LAERQLSPAEVMKVSGVPGLLLNNAAVINRPAPLWELNAKELSEVVDINLKGGCHVIRHFVPAMIQEGRGVIVNFSSGWGRSTDRDVAVYCASKWAIEGLTQAMAKELPEGMAAVALNPGIIDTEMLRACFGEGAASYPRAEEWARKAVPFLSLLNARHNGQSLTVPD
jgi:NAD(P)-dependent dehydrogenase (short-subunit alcohol dehydrogenase family)